MRRHAVPLLVALLGVVLAATLVGLVALWPSGEPLETSVPPGEERTATVVAVAEAPCTVPGSVECLRVTAELTSGPERGSRTTLVLGETGRAPDVRVGDEIRLLELVAGPEAPGVPPGPRYSFVDFERDRPLTALVLLFAALVVLAGRWQGARSLVGLALSLVVVVTFVVPAILEGSSPALVALTGALAVMFATIPLTHGLGPKTLAACLGTASSLLLILVLGSLFVDLARLSGASSDEALYLGAVAGDVSLQGLLLAGLVIAALGVLDDVTVSQASTVMALRRANPALAWRRLCAEALDVGRDHIAATVNTLVLAYVGASLPVLLVFSLAGRSITDSVTSEVVAVEIVATLVGSIGLIAAVPITTALAAFLALRLRVDQLPGHAH